MKEYKILRDVGDFFHKGDTLNEETIRQWFNRTGFKELIKDGYIVEKQKLKFTEEDVIAFANWCEIEAYKYLDKSRSVSFVMLPNLYEWVKENKK